MTSKIEAKLNELGLELPAPAAPVATYVPYVVTGSLVFISGQVPLTANGLEYQGKVGDIYSVEDGQAAARLCALNILAQAKTAAGGDLDRLARCVKLGGFVNCTPDFDKHPLVINGASDLIAAVMGDAGRHARFAVGAPSLPMDVAVEVDATFELA